MNKKITCTVISIFLSLLSLLNLVLLTFAYRDLSWGLLAMFVFQIVSSIGVVVLVQFGLGLFSTSTELLEEEDIEEFNLEGRFLLNE